MSNGTITLTVSLGVVTSQGSSDALAVSQASFAQTGTRKLKDILQCSTSAAAVPLPGGTLGFAAFKNLDPTNTISLRNGAGGANFTDIPPLAAVNIYISSGNTLYAIAAGGTPNLEYMILEA